MKRLYRKIYLTILGSLLLVVLVAGGVWQFGAQRPGIGEALDLAGNLAAASLPPADAPAEAQREGLARIAEVLGRDVALYDADRQLVAATGEDPAPPRRLRGSGWTHGPLGPAWTIALADGRWLVLDLGPNHRNPALALVLFLGAIAIAVGISAYPVARGLTRRLERLKAGVETLGAGNFGSRVKVEGKDEVAHLAESFNQAAARIEELVAANRMMLANASHELRTPLSRIRLALELWERDPGPKLKAELETDIAELDELVDEILLASRLDARHGPAAIKEVDLQALCAEECARFDDCDLVGEAAVVTGDPSLLRRLVRNLLDNATRHGRPPIVVSLRREGSRVALAVLDSGNGVPEGERERVFAPFYRLGGGKAGAGLGLSLVRQIARLHGGEAEVWRDPATGLAGFRIDLPARP